MQSERNLNFGVAVLVLVCLSLAGVVVMLSGDPPAASPDSYARMAAVWTRAQALIPLLASLAGLASIWIGYHAAVSARDTARATLDANRPWIDLDVALDGPLQEAAGRAEIRVVVKMKNFGNSPAAWTNVFAFVDRLGRNSDPFFSGLHGTSVFQGQTADRKLMAPLLDFTTRGMFGESFLVLRVRVEYPLPGNPDLGVTARCWEIKGPYMGGVDLNRLPIGQKEHLHIRHLQEDDVTA